MVERGKGEEELGKSKQGVKKERKNQTKTMVQSGKNRRWKAGREEETMEVVGEGGRTMETGKEEETMVEKRREGGRTKRCKKKKKRGGGGEGDKAMI